MLQPKKNLLIEKNDTLHSLIIWIDDLDGALKKIKALPYVGFVYKFPHFLTCSVDKRYDLSEVHQEIERLLTPIPDIFTTGFDKGDVIE